MSRLLPPYNAIDAIKAAARYHHGKDSPLYKLMIFRTVMGLSHRLALCAEIADCLQVIDLPASERESLQNVRTLAICAPYHEELVPEETAS